MRYTKFVIAFSFLLITTIVQTQDQWINCLSGVHINDVVDTELQTLIATSGGFVVYSKITESTTFYNRGNSNIESNFVSQVEVDKSGSIWIETDIGVSQFIFNQFNKITNLSGILAIDQDGDLVIANSSNIHTYDGVTFDTLLVETQTGFLIASDIIYHSSENEIWMSQATLDNLK